MVFEGFSNGLLVFVGFIRFEGLEAKTAKSTTYKEPVVVVVFGFPLSKKLVGFQGVPYWSHNDVESFIVQ